MSSSHFRGTLRNIGRLVTFTAIGIAVNDCVVGVTFTGDRCSRSPDPFKSNLPHPRPQAPIVVEHWKLLIWGPERCIQRGDEVVMVDPFEPQKKVLRRVVALPDDYVSMSKGLVFYHARVDDGCYFVEDEAQKGMVRERMTYSPVNVWLDGPCGVSAGEGALSLLAVD